MRLFIAAALALVAAPALANDFSEGSAAKEWGLLGEEKARFEAKVVDLLCEVGGDCPPDCGAGARQLGLLRSPDGALIVPMKNGQPLFNGAADDLQPWCGKDVEVDGVLVGDEEQTPVKFYMVQFIREAGAGKWSKADRWTKVWAERNPEAATQEGPWFRKDPRVGAKIAADGYLGLGAEMDATFIEYYFQ
ncbi:MAG: hypothetical protein WD969_08450 [Paracoccaceae bacterium]